MVLVNRLAGEISYFKSMMPKINVLPSFNSLGSRAQLCLVGSSNTRAFEHHLHLSRPLWRRARRIFPRNFRNDKIQVPLTSYESPEEIRDDLARGAITAIVSGNFFSQAYLAVYTSAQSILEGKPLLQGWLKVPHVIIDKGKIAAYQKAWENLKPACVPSTVRWVQKRLAIICRRPCLAADLFVHPVE